MCVAGGLKKPLGVTVGWPVVPACRMDVGVWEGESHDAVSNVVGLWGGDLAELAMRCAGQRGVTGSSRSSSSSDINSSSNISAQSPDF